LPKDCDPELVEGWLEKRSFNITKELGFLINTFEDFRFVAQIKEEVENLNRIIS